MFQKREMRLSGSGGQGVILAAIIFADAAIEDGLNAIQTQSYGPEARGGASKAEVIISDSDINYPKVMNNKLLLSLTQKAFDKYIGKIDEDGILIVDESVEVPSDIKVKTIYKLPILRTAKEKIGIAMVANIVSIGVIYELACKDIIKLETIKSTIAGRVPKATIEKNIKAFEEGVALVRG
ncbi:2-oxoacid:acceptor oxidoreductase family protein [Sedimentibacter sp. zth1]|uniref:2-oxoacid:acceptor oxidoreductase family protein n=1 Tax=Sedimentibacter sp. zth1 TaxID=2816908 RepID=UPI001A917F1A|nr:2-oxoacid:acceptor oxidoreductase family protein [Sedimentibacter sp. zth1]QSX06790.1 2-oxoacid:acceptor oxidoreductase family protein [Sedimentibacter sp. zth1]